MGNSFSSGSDRSSARAMAGSVCWGKPRMARVWSVGSVFDGTGKSTLPADNPVQFQKDLSHTDFLRASIQSTFSIARDAAATAVHNAYLCDLRRARFGISDQLSWLSVGAFRKYSGGI